MSKVRPILFSAPMIRALLAGAKTQTRRALRVQPPAGTFQVSTWHHPDPRPHFFAWQELPHDTAMIADDWRHPCPYGAPGDHLWVREAWARDDEDGTLFYRADVGTGNGADDWERNRLDGVARYRWRPSIHMPRWASRITLEITGVRVKRLNDMNRGDAMAEGCPFPNMAGSPSPLQWYAGLWEQINGSGSWSRNPYVWVVEFRKPQNVELTGRPEAQP